MVHRCRRGRRHAPHGARQRSATAGLRPPERRAVAADDRGVADEGRSAGYASVARAAVHELDANQPAGRIRTMTAVVSDAVARQRFTMFLAALFAALALVLVARRPLRRRLVLGRRANPRARAPSRARRDAAQPARPGTLRRPAAGGNRRRAGADDAFVLARFLESQLFGVTAHDPGTFIVVPAPADRRRRPRLPDSCPPRNAYRPDDGTADTIRRGGRHRSRHSQS